MPASPPARPTARPIGRATATALVVVLVTLLAGATDAAADAARPTNFESVIDSIEPDPDQVDVRIVGGDSFVQVTVDPGSEVEIPGYDGEPYLRIDAAGTVFRNRRSAATYLNESRFGTGGGLPDRVDSSAAPDWERIGDGGVVAWHDHRVHWMLEDAPRTADGVVQDWVVPLTVDGTEVLVSGRLLLRPDEPPWPAFVALAVAAIVAWRARGELARTLLLAGASSVALASSVTWYVANPPGAEPTLAPILLSALALTASVVARVTPRPARYLALPLASVALLAGWFVQRVGVLWMPTLPGGLAEPIERLLAAGVAGVAAGVAIAILVRPYPGSAALTEPGGQEPSTRNSSGSQSSTPPRS